MAKQFYDQIPQTDFTGLVQAYQQNTAASSFLSPFLKTQSAEAPAKPVLSIMDYIDGMKEETARVPATKKYTDYAAKTFSLENAKNAFVGTISAMTGIDFDTASDLTGVDNTIATDGPPATESSGPGFAEMIESYVGRIAIIILGFVFVAAGLAMFKVIPAPVVNVARNAARGAV